MSGDVYTINATDTNVGDTLDCVATIVDIDGASTSETTSVIIENTAPVVDQSAISPIVGITTSSTLTCTGTGTDVDQDSLTVTYTWDNLTQNTNLPNRDAQ